MDQEKFSPGIKSYFLIIYSGLVPNNDISTITTFNGYKAMMQPTNRTYETNDQLENIEKKCSVCLQII